jgi:3-methyladenine DNA glycosylase/8-oxoguanine DNA glycosylase
LENIQTVKNIKGIGSWTVDTTILFFSISNNIYTNFFLEGDYNIKKWQKKFGRDLPKVNLSLLSYYLMTSRKFREFLLFPFANSVNFHL